MAKITNFDTLKRLHDWARVAKVGSREWIEFATTMMDSFPELYVTAKGMNAELESLRRDAERYRWLRDSNLSGAAIRMLYEDGETTPEACDAAIDEAMTG